MKLLLLLCFSGCFLDSFSQDKNQFYALDKNMNQTVLDSSKYILWIHEKKDSNWQWDYYYTWGSLVKSTSFADHDGTIQNGRFCLYNIYGNLDSVGVIDHGKKNGSFYKYRTYTKDSFEIIHQYDYAEDSLIKSINIAPGKEKDSDTANSKESEYPGGIKAWFAYLGNHLSYPDRAVSKEIQGQVKIYFEVDGDGNVKESYILKSIEYSLDQESLRVINESGKWNPGVKDGIRVKTYKVMPVNFKLEAQ
jgi:periplasmic protein TonB